MVRDSKGESLSGVSIKLKGSTTGTTTDPDGKYSIDITGNGVLVFTYVGYADQEIAVNNQRTINVVLEETIKSMDTAVVVVGYGTVRRRDLTGSVSSISRDEIRLASH